MCDWIPAGRPRLFWESLRARRKAGRDGAAEFDHPFDYLGGGLEHHQLLPSGQTNDRVGGRLERLDQVRVEHQRQTIEAREVNHETFNPYRPEPLLLPSESRVCARSARSARGSAACR